MVANLFSLLNLLDKEKIHYKIERTRTDAIQITAVFVGARIEIEAFEDGHFEMSRFVGNEDVESGSIEMIQGLIRELA